MPAYMPRVFGSGCQCDNFRCGLGTNIRESCSGEFIIETQSTIVYHVQKKIKNNCKLSVAFELVTENLLSSLL